MSVRVCACLCLCVSVCVSRRAFSDFERIQTRLCGRGGVVCARSDACRDHEEVYASVCSVVQRAARIREAFSTRHQRTKAAGGQRAARLARSAGAVECVRVCVCSCVRVFVCACVLAFDGAQVTVSLARASSVLASPRLPTSQAVTRAPPSTRSTLPTYAPRLCSRASSGPPTWVGWTPGRGVPVCRLSDHPELG